MKRAWRKMIFLCLAVLILCPVSGCSAHPGQAESEATSKESEAPSKDSEAASKESKAEAEDGEVRIRVFETTDIHGILVDTSSGNEDTFQYRLARIARIVEEARESGEFDDVLLADGGDIYQGDPVSDALDGAALRAAFDVMGYDAVALGNHEFDREVTKLSADADGTVPAYELGERRGDPDIPVLAANLYDAASGERVGFTRDYTIVEKAGLRIALIGYIPNYAGSITAEKIAPYRIDGNLERFAEKVHEIRKEEKPDVTIVLAHEKPERVAEAMDPGEVDLVLGGHSHWIAAGTAGNGIAFLQANCKAAGYAQAVIVRDAAGNVRIEEPEYISITTDRKALYDKPENADLLDQEILALSHDAWDGVSDVMGELLGKTSVSIEKTPTGDNGSTIAGNWVTGLMLRAAEHQGAVAAFYNSGGIRSELKIPRGETERAITVGDIYRMMPFGNKLYVYELTGAEIAQQIEDGFYHSDFGDQMSGLTFSYEVSEDGGVIMVRSITLADGTEVDPLDEKKTYRICASEYSGTLSGSVFEKKKPLFPEPEAPVDNIAFIELLREEAKANNGRISVDTGGRGYAIRVLYEEAA